MNAGDIAGVNPQALELERRPRAGAQAEHVAVERAGFFEILGQHHVVLHV